MKKTKNLEEFTRDLSFKLPRTVPDCLKLAGNGGFPMTLGCHLLCSVLPPCYCCCCCAWREAEGVEEEAAGGEQEAWRWWGVKWFGLVRKKESNRERKRKRNRGGRPRQRGKKIGGVGSCKPRIIWQISALVPEISWPQFFFIYK